MIGPEEAYFLIIDYRVGGVPNWDSVDCHTQPLASVP